MYLYKLEPRLYFWRISIATVSKNIAIISPHTPYNRYKATAIEFLSNCVALIRIHWKFSPITEKRVRLLCGVEW